MWKRIDTSFLQLLLQFKLKKLGKKTGCNKSNYLFDNVVNLFLDNAIMSFQNGIDISNPRAKRNWKHK